MSAIRDALSPVRQPEYTGENRCIPCTVVNLAIAAVLSLAVWVWLSAVLAVVVAAVSVAAIVLRGYLVPGTPALTKRYLPDRVLALFDKGPTPRTATAVGSGVEAAASGGAAGAGTAPSGTDAAGDGSVDGAQSGGAGDDPSGEDSPGDDAPNGGPPGDDAPGDGATDVERMLVSAGLVEECADRDDLCLAPSFRETWRERMDDFDSEEARRRAASQIYDQDPEDLTFEPRSNVKLGDEGEAEMDTFCVLLDGLYFDEYESRAAFVAEMAAVDLLAERVPAWDDLSEPARRNLLGSLRLFLDFCPACGGPVGFSEDAVESCCRSFDVVAATCLDCGERVFELQVDA
ncbi:MAG: hypothetical protein ABEJ28_01730 [Salinigranum sp.]